MTAAGGRASTSSSSTARPTSWMVDVAVGETAGWELLEQLHAYAVTQEIPVLVVSTGPAAPATSARPAWARRCLRKLWDSCGTHVLTILSCPAMSRPDRRPPH